MKLKKGDWIALSIIGIIIIGLIAVYFTFFFSYKCDNMSCYVAHQKKCARTVFIKDDIDITWKYHIKGKEGETCKIYVEVLAIKEGTIDKKRLENLGMNCYLPLGSSINPESNLDICHGELKEEFQAMMIQKMHSYILNNLGEIKEEFKQSL